MKTFDKSLLSAAICILLCWGCGEREQVDRSDSLNTGRGFIEASLKGDFATADRYMLPDSINEQYLKRWDDFRQKLSVLEREEYRDASILIDSTKELNDSTDVIYFRNSYKKEPTKLKVIKVPDGGWKVDFKYTFHDDEDGK